MPLRATKESEHHTSKTLIDHFSLNKPKYILSSGVVKSGMVDHYMIYAIQKVNAWGIRSKKSKILEARSLRNYGKAKFLNDIKEVNWELGFGGFGCGVGGFGCGTLSLQNPSNSHTLSGCGGKTTILMGKRMLATAIIEGFSS